MLKNIKKRLTIQWYEWRDYQISVWNIRRDNRAIDRAIKRAVQKNRTDGKTYIILKNNRGGFDEVTWRQVQLLRRKRINHFPIYQDYYVMLTFAFAIVTGSEVQRRSYVETMKKVNEMYSPPPANALATSEYDVPSNPPFNRARR